MAASGLTIRDPYSEIHFAQEMNCFVSRVSHQRLEDEALCGLFKGSDLLSDATS